MRIGINDYVPHTNPEEWADRLLAEGFSASGFPVDYRAKDSVIDAYLKAARERDIMIAEVGIWDSPFQMDQEKAAYAKERSYRQLELADYVGARCCVNVSGGCGVHWAGLDKGNFGPEIYQKNVAFVQEMLDTVKPQNTFFTLEPMQWMVPDSPDQYLQFVKDVDREHFGVHMDFVNFIKDPYTYTHQEELLDRTFDLLGSQIRSCHIKDCLLDPGLTVAIHEVPLGQGEANWKYYLGKIEKLDADMPVLLEHLSDFTLYQKVRQVLRDFGL